MNTYSKTMLAVAILNAFVCDAQITGSISGRVVDTTGKPIAGIVVGASKIPDLAKKDFSNLVTVRSATAADGSFRVGGLAAASYRLCAHSTIGPYLNTCNWPTVADPHKVSLAAGAAQNGITIVMTKGTVMKVVVSDPQGLLSKTAKSAAGTNFELTISGKNFPTVPLSCATTTATLRTCSASVPAQFALEVRVRHDNLKVTDNGGKVAFSEGKNSVTVADGDENLGIPHMSLKVEAAK